ncbi:MAG: hypothetical protein E6860_15605 [Clostridium sp.]|uniref:hypothetical protein n=1 Tax=Clostridium sp. TaxID=1506 RepID=UPI002900C54F|nr:hypothetical protein [Clostridium sp.]MDU1586960.1 hypothetical protein [Clostridium sp.]
MSNIYSNLFSLDTDFKEEVVNVKNEKKKTIEYTSLSDEFKSKCYSILMTCKGYEPKDFKEIEINFNNFSDYHYDIMKHRLIIISFDKNTNQYKYLTPEGKVYITSDPKVTSIIHMVPKPYKISFGYVPRVEYEKITSFLMLSKVIYQEDSTNLEIIISKFIKPTVKIDSSSEYSLLYYIFNIYPKIEAIITNNRYWKYINLQQYIFELSNKIKETNSLINLINLDNMIVDLKKEIHTLLNTLNIDFNGTYNKEDILLALFEKTQIYPTLDSFILNLLNEEDVMTLKNSLDTLEVLNCIKDTGSLADIDIHNRAGIIESRNVLNKNIFSNKVLIRGSYDDIYFKLLAHCTYNKILTSSIKEDTKLIYSLLSDSDIDNKELTSHLLETYVLAKLNNCNSEEDILNFFHNTTNTILLKEDLDYLEETYSKYLIPLDKAINNFNNQQYYNEQPKILSEDTSYLNKNILDKQNTIMKNLLKEIDMYCNDFNERNKDKMNICYFDSSNVYLLADKGAFNTAFDTLTRIMPLVFSSFCKNITSSCYIKVIE